MYWRTLSKIMPHVQQPVGIWKQNDVTESIRFNLRAADTMNSTSLSELTVRLYKLTASAFQIMKILETPPQSNILKFCSRSHKHQSDTFSIIAGFKVCKLIQRHGGIQVCFYW